MQPALWKTIVFFGGLLIQLVAAQQYAGDFINNSLPYVPGAEINYFKIKEPTGKVPKAYNLTLINYQSLQANGQRLVPSQIQRAVVIIHGLQRDPGTYISNIQSALAQVSDPNINKSSVLMMAPYFPNGDDKNYGYPYNETNPAAPGKVYSGSARSYTGALVWSGSAWSGGGANQYPAAYQTVSSYYVLDQLIQWFGNTANFPNMKEIIIAGHSLGGQTVQRYAVAGPLPTALGVTIPVTYWIANPNSYVWLNSSRPLSTASCANYDQWRDGLTNFTGYTSPAVYQQSLMTSGVTAIQNNYYAKNKAYARGLADTGDDSSGCAPELSGSNRNERFFAFLNWFPQAAQCQAPNSTTGHCDTVDEVNIGHDAGAMMSCPAGQARLFTDNFYGNGSRAYDFGYPRVQAGDDPFPNPDLASTSTANKTVYAGNMTLQGCYSDNTGERTLAYTAYDSSSNTIEMCTQTCVNAGYTVAGVEYGSQCYCGNAIGGEADLVVSVACNQACAGNSSETCGAAGRINIYSNGQPTQLEAPGQPDAVLDSPANVYYDFLDCYSEATSGRALSAKSYSDTKNMTLENCAAFCSGYKYFGVEYAQECYCGSCFNAGASIIDNGKCSMTCTGDSTEYCGAGNALSVYQLDSSSGLAVISQSCAAGSTTTTTSAAPTSTIPAASLCPNVDGQTILDSNNNNYTVHCSSDNSVGSYSSSSASNSYLDCMTACDAQSSCLGFTYVGAAYGAGAGTCYLKSSAGTYTSAGTNLISAFKASSGSSSSSSASGTATSSAAATSSSSAANLCPAADGTTITDSNGNNYTVHCASDNSVGSYASASATNTYLDCMTACDAQSSCLGFTYVGATYGAGSGTCYLKSAVGTYTSAGTNLISAFKPTSGSSSSSSSVVSGTTSTSTTSAAATSSSSAANLCPAADGTTITDSNGSNYTVHCSSDNSVGSYASASASNSYLDCMTACDAQSSTGCVGFTYVGATYGAGSGTCYLKTSAGTFTSAGTNLISAFKASSGAVSSSSSSSSVSGTTTSSTSSAAATSSSAANLCPATNGQTITDSKGNNYTVHCASDNSVGSYASASASSSYLDCMTACDAQSSTGCTGFTYVGANYGAGSGTCYLKTSMGTYTSAGANLISAVKVASGSSSSSSSASSASSTTTSSGSSASSSAAATNSAVSCPGSDQSTYTASNGAQFLIECGIDHQGGDLTSIGGVDFAGCINACATTAGCVDVSLSGSACYEKSVLGAAVSNAGIWGAKLITSSSSSSSSSVATTSSTSSTSSVASTSSSTVSTSSTSSTSSPAVTSSSSTTSTVASSTTSAFPSATATTCPGMDQSSMVDANGATYNIYCSADTGNQVLAVQQTSTGILGCMANCDQTTGCTAFTYSGDSTMTNGWCYLRTIGSRSSGGSTLAVGQLVSSGTTANQNNAVSSGTSSTSTSSSTSSPAPTSTSSSSTVSTTSSSTSSSSTTSVTPAAPTVVGNYTSLGCYNDTVSARALQGGYTSNSKMTIEMCGSYCSGYTYWGVEYGQECYCGNTLLNGSQNKTLSSCSFTCPGNSTELCGAGNRLQMYSLTPSSSTSSSSTSSTSSASITSSATSSTGTTSSSSSTTTSTGTPQRRRRGLAGMRA